MNFFDLFRKKKKQKNTNIDSTTELSIDKQTNDKTPVSSNDLTDSSIFNIEIDGETLVRVEYKDFSNQDDNVVFVVPKEVKAIYPYAFSRIKNLRKVIMHKDIRYIDQTAFNGCEKLQSVIGLEESETMKNFNGFCYGYTEVMLNKLLTEGTAYVGYFKDLYGIDCLHTYAVYNGIAYDPGQNIIMNNDDYIRMRNFEVLFKLNKKDLFEQIEYYENNDVDFKSSYVNNIHKLAMIKKLK